MCVYKKENPFLVYCRELAPCTVSLTRDRAQGDDSKHDSHYTVMPNKSDSYVIFCLQLLSKILTCILSSMFTVVALGPVTC